MPKFTLQDPTPVVKLSLFENQDGSVSLIADGGPNEDEQVLLDVLPDGSIRRDRIDQTAARRLGLRLTPDRFIVVDGHFDVTADGFGSREGDFPDVR